MSSEGPLSESSPRKVQQPTFENASADVQGSDINSNSAHGRHIEASSAADVAGDKASSSGTGILGFFSSIFSYRKTTLTLFTFVTLVLTYTLFSLDSSLELSIDLPTDAFETKILDHAWLDLQVIGKSEHPYASVGNDNVHDYLRERIAKSIAKQPLFMELDTDSGNDILYAPAKGHLAYYESNNLVVRINGTNSKLPALLVSAHYDSVPTSFGITDDGMGIASMLGLVEYFATTKAKQPVRTIIFNFNNDEEFGLYGATTFVLSHPWFKQIKYFLNLEGTGAGGKCVLFRGTDYGITKYFKYVRYPFGTSLFQQGFNNKLIHSETDYKVYKEDGGIRGIDLAFYKPRDIYHTASDNIRNVNKLSLWNMLSNSIDFVEAIVRSKIDLDAEYEKKNASTNLLEFIDDEFTQSRSFPAFGTLFNYIVVFPISSLVIINSALLVAIPLINFPLLLVVFYYKKTWSINFINFVKLPLSFGVSIFLLSGVMKYFRLINEFLPNNNYLIIVSTSFFIFSFFNYLFLNVFNYIFYHFKIHDHDEKLINILQVSFVYWVILIFSTVKLAYNKIGDDHTGEYPITGLLVLQSLGGLLGIFGFLLKSKKHKKNYRYEFIHEEQPLLNDVENYGSNDGETAPQGDIRPPSSSSSFLLTSSVLNADENSIKPKKEKTYSYGWSLQFLLIVPICSFIIFNSGTLILDGINKSIQESFASETLIYDFIKDFAIIWTLPFIAFIYKINRFGVALWIIAIGYGLIIIHSSEPFDQLNPLKLRFIQSLNSDNSSVIDAYARIGTPLKAILLDLPSVKQSKEIPICSDIGDGMEVCSFNSTLAPNLIPNNGKAFDDYLNVTILKNSLNEPFGLLTGEIEITAPKNRLCSLQFYQEGFTSPLPVKTVIVYDDTPKSNKTRSYNKVMDVAGIPKGSSKDEYGNFYYKDFDGISDLQLNKLDWEKPYHIGFQWVPSIEMSDVADANRINKLSVEVKCYWGDLESFSDDGSVKETIPAYNELLHYSPNYVTWANREKGLVVTSKSVQV